MIYRRRRLQQPSPKNGTMARQQKLRPKARAKPSYQPRAVSGYCRTSICESERISHRATAKQTGRLSTHPGLALNQVNAAPYSASRKLYSTIASVTLPCSIAKPKRTTFTRNSRDSGCALPVFLVSGFFFVKKHMRTSLTSNHLKCDMCA
jgi:hypothetical protein